MTRSLYIKNGYILTMGEKGNLSSGGVLIDNGKIIDVGEDIEIPEECKTIDAKGGYIMPGIIDAHCHIGIFETGIGEAGVDGNEDTNAITPEIRAIDGIYTLDKEFARSYKNGVTCVATGPGSANPIGGQFVGMKTVGNLINNMVVKEPLAMKFAFGENPKNSHGKKGKMPITRMGVAALIRNTLYKAKEYDRRKNNAIKLDNPDKLPPFDLGMEALLPVIRKELPIKAHAHRADDIMTAIRIAKEFDLSMTLDHCSEGHLIAEELANAGYGVILGPFGGFPHKNEVINQELESTAILHEAGVKIAIMTDLPAMHTENLIRCAGMCYGAGLPEDVAFKSVTINAAEILGLDNRMGSLEEGKDGDVIIFDINPIKNIHAKCIFTAVDGVVVHDIMG